MCVVTDAASWGFAGAAACPCPQRGPACCTRVRPHWPYHPYSPLPACPWKLCSSGPVELGNNQEVGGWTEASPLPPAGELRKAALNWGRTGGEDPGLSDGGCPGSHSTGCMQGGIWDMQLWLHKDKYTHICQNTHIYTNTGIENKCKKRNQSNPTWYFGLKTFLKLSNISAAKKLLFVWFYFEGQKN